MADSHLPRSKPAAVPVDRCRSCRGFRSRDDNHPRSCRACFRKKDPCSQRCPCQYCQSWEPRMWLRSLRRERAKVKAAELFAALNDVRIPPSGVVSGAARPGIPPVVDELSVLCASQETPSEFEEGECDTSASMAGESESGDSRTFRADERPSSSRAGERERGPSTSGLLTTRKQSHEPRKQSDRHAVERSSGRKNVADSDRPRSVVTGPGQTLTGPGQV